MTARRPRVVIDHRDPAPPFAGDTFDTPLGRMVAVVDATAALVALEFLRADGSGPVLPDWRWRGEAVARDAGAIAAIRRRLDEYFAGRRRDFDLALAPIGTAFQREVWRMLTAIAHGTTISYAELARRIGRPTATRAVGHANGRNPIAIVVPCHRVIGADGSLTGYGGGLERKAALLALEGATPAPRQRALPLG